MLFVHSDTDYDSIAVQITFDPSPTDATICENIGLLLDNVIEDGETFTVEITTTDTNIDILIPSATVAIQDESTISIEFDRNVYSIRELDGMIEVCAEISGGTLQRNVEVEFSSQDSTASGKSSDNS